MKIRRPIIVVKGSIPDCVHYEIVVDLVGTCRLCGQVRDYRPCYDDDGDSLVKTKARKGQAALQERRKAAVYG